MRFPVQACLTGEDEAKRNADEKQGKRNQEKGEVERFRNAMRPDQHQHDEHKADADEALHPGCSGSPAHVLPPGGGTR